MPWYAFCKNDDFHHLVSADDPDVACCGKQVDWAPNVQPDEPNLHPSCRVSTVLPAAGPPDLPDPPPAYAAKARRKLPPTNGTCPVCGASVRAVAGKVLPHRQWRMGAGGKYLGPMCSGRGEDVEVGP